MSCESPLGCRTLRKERTTTGKPGESRGEEQPGGAQRSRMSCESPLGLSNAPKGADDNWETRGVQGGVAARRSAEEPDELRIPPWVVERSEGSGRQLGNQGSPGGSSSPAERRGAG